MPKPLRNLLIALALLGIAVAVWIGLARPPRAGDDGAAPRASGLESATDLAKIPEIAELSGGRTETAAEPGAPTFEASANASTPLAESNSASNNVAKLTARFVDPLGNPWPGVLLFDSQRQDVSATSDANGDVTLAVPQPWSTTSWSVEWIARRKGCATRQLSCTLTIGGSTQLGEVVLVPGVDIYGRTVDETGTAISALVGQQVAEFDPTDEARRGDVEYVNLHSILVAESLPNGEFRLEGMPVGETRLWAKGHDTRMVWSDEFTLVEGVDLHGFVITLPRVRDEDAIAGTVLTPDGNPAGEVIVSCTYESPGRSGWRGVQSGADGRFRIVVEPGFVTYNLSASDPLQRHTDAWLRDVKPGTRDIELRLRVSEPFQLVLRGPQGELVNDCRLLTYRESVSGGWDGTHSFPKSNGEARYELVVPPGRMQFEIEAKGYVKYVTDKLERPAAHSTIEIQLTRSRLLRGRVLAEGRPVADASVSRFPDAGDIAYFVNGFRSVHDRRPEAEATTDAEGRFELPFSGDERQWIRAVAPGFAPSELGPLVPDESTALEFALVRGGAIEGVVLLPDGADAEGAIVGLSRGDGFGRSCRAGPAGRYRFEGLTPGPWQLVQLDRELDPHSGITVKMRSSDPIEWSCEVHDGRTTRFDLDLSRP